MGYDPDQPRDEQGRWTSSGGTSSGKKEGLLNRRYMNEAGSISSGRISFITTSRMSRSLGQEIENNYAAALIRGQKERFAQTQKLKKSAAPVLRNIKQMQSYTKIAMRVFKRG